MAGMTRFTAALTTTLLALCVTGCGGSEPTTIGADPESPGTSAEQTSAPATPQADPREAVELVVQWAQAIADGDGPEACGYQTRAFTRAMVRETVQEGFAAAGSSCTDVVETMSRILKSFGTTGKPVIRLLSSTTDRATVTLGLSSAKASDAYRLVYRNGAWLLNADVSDEVLEK